MNTRLLLNEIESVSGELYQEDFFVEKLCKKIVVWETEHVSMSLPHYKEPYKQFIHEIIEEKLSKGEANDTL